MKKIIIITLLIIFTMFVSGVVLAQSVSTGEDGPTVSTGEDGPTVSTGVETKVFTKLRNPIKADSIEEVILLIVDIMVYLGVALAILSIIWVGFLFVLAQGNPKKIEDARRYFFYIIIGLAVLISARVIVEIVENTLIQSGVVEQGVFRNE